MGIFRHPVHLVTYFPSRSVPSLVLFTASIPLSRGSSISLSFKFSIREPELLEDGLEYYNKCNSSLPSSFTYEASPGSCYTCWYKHNIHCSTVALMSLQALEKPSFAFSQLLTTQFHAPLYSSIPIRCIRSLQHAAPHIDLSRAVGSMSPCNSIVNYRCTSQLCSTQAAMTFRVLRLCQDYKSDPIKKSLPLSLTPFPCFPKLFCEMQLEKITIRIPLFYLIQKNLTLKPCATCRCYFWSCSYLGASSRN
jgi:hypothetical protein